MKISTISIHIHLKRMCFVFFPKIDKTTVTDRVVWEPGFQNFRLRLRSLIFKIGPAPLKNSAAQKLPLVATPGQLWLRSAFRGQ